MDAKEVIEQFLGENEWKVVNEISYSFGYSIKYSCRYCFSQEISLHEYKGPESLTHASNCVVLEARKILSNEKDE